MANQNACAIPQPCDPRELEPLLRAVQSADRPTEARMFPRGALLPDGRLDLCKQQLGPVNVDSVTRALSGNPFVRSLLLGADFIGDDGARSVAGLIAGESQIETLFLGCNGISSRGLDALLDAATQSTRLRSLWLKRNPLGLVGARALSDFLRHDRTLTTLDVVATDIGAEGASEILRALAESNRTLRRLYLCANDLGPSIVEPLAELLQSPCPISALYLTCNALGDEGAVALARALGPGSLRELGLASNRIGCVGAVDISRELGGTDIQYLEVGHAPATGVYEAAPNQIADEGAAALAGLVRDSPLHTLLLGGNRIGATGGVALLRAVEQSASLQRIELCRDIPKVMRHRIQAKVKQNRELRPRPPVPDDLLAIQSVFRTRRVAAAPAVTLDETRVHALSSEPEAPVPHRAPVDPDTLSSVVQVLTELAATPQVFFDGRQYAPVRAAANRLVDSLVQEARRRRNRDGSNGRTPRADSAATRANQGKRDRTVSATAVIRAQRAGLRDAKRTVESHAPARYAHARTCHICEQRFSERHFFYDALCPSCAEVNYSKREQTGPLDGQRALVTGGRIKIGYHAVLKLLRAGASVVLTTRFPCDAAEKITREPDFAEFHGRVQIVGIDFRDLRAVEGLAAHLARELDRLDIVINNAAQTIQRPAGFYAALIEKERAGIATLSTAARALLVPDTVMSSRGALPVLEHNEPPNSDLPTLFPRFAIDEDGQPLDLRPTNSWRLGVQEVSTLELLETQAVNSLAPFLLIRGLLDRMRAGASSPRHIVNVSAMEGSFSRSYKSHRHVHTNMAKASLNMLTRTLAEQLALDHIYVNSVDPGWVTNEQPFTLREAMRERHDFEPPLDVVDGAARVCDPIFRVALGEPPRFGEFLKDYGRCDW